MRSSLFHRLKALRGNHNRHFLSEFGDEKGLFLEVYVTATLARGVELRCADAVRVPSAN